MADFKRQMFGHLRSAKIWLARAEESFDNDSDVRGELNLFLAQAELQHAREKNLSQRWQYKYPLIRHVLSVALAMVFVFGGYGAYQLAIRQPSMTSAPSLAVNEPMTVSESKVAQAVVAVNPADAETSAVPVTAQTTNQPTLSEPPVGPVVINSPALSSPTVTVAEVKHQSAATSAAKEKLLSPDEMEKVIRAAEKSLRGQ
ncbi:MAG: hypothetical protein H6Q74_804 [Firmicutes bacterium]|nr:hypothetical protein [Bacillota bacterium]